ncbi:hypothetical protein, partial [Enterococcus faecalis]|uniref:hypothetical protein n=1 Tax=Enterococcus faecalis TaxID=1351 RepID=UPI0039871D45
KAGFTAFEPFPCLPGYAALWHTLVAKGEKKHGSVAKRCGGLGAAKRGCFVRFENRHGIKS